MDWARRTELLSVLVASVVAIVGLWYTSLQISQTNEQARDDRALAKEGQITDRYTAAVETLGEDKVDVRLGGIYALQRIMKDSHCDQPTIANVLAAYVRTHAAKPPEKGQDVPADVQAALSVLATRDDAYDGSFVPALRSVWIPRVELGPTQIRHSADGPVSEGGGARLGSANLISAHLAGAGLTHAYLEAADLRQADLRGADLGSAHLASAYMVDADLRGADLTGADVRYANLSGADLRGARLEFGQLENTFMDTTTKLPDGCTASIGPFPPPRMGPFLPSYTNPLPQHCSTAMGPKESARASRGAERFPHRAGVIPQW